MLSTYMITFWKDDGLSFFVIVYLYIQMKIKESLFVLFFQKGNLIQKCSPWNVLTQFRESKWIKTRKTVFEWKQSSWVLIFFLKLEGVIPEGDGPTPRPPPSQCNTNNHPSTLKNEKDCFWIKTNITIFFYKPQDLKKMWTSLGDLCYWQNVVVWKYN